MKKYESKHEKLSQHVNSHRPALEYMATIAVVRSLDLQLDRRTLYHEFAIKMCYCRNRVYGIILSVWSTLKSIKTLLSTGDATLL